MIIEIDSEVLSSVFSAIDRNHDKWWFSIDDCALAWGFERTYFYRRRFLLPNFGVFDDPDHHAFSRESFMKWVTVPLTKHAQEWTALSADERRKIEKHQVPKGITVK
jgi:hypothetical protein